MDMVAKKLRRELDKAAKKWAYLSEPAYSECLSLFGERLVRDPHLHPAYLRKKVQQQVFKELKKRGVLCEVEDLVGSVIEDPELELLLQQIPPDEERILRGYFFEGFSKKELAEKYNMSIYSLNQYFNAGLGSLREVYGVG